MGKILTEDKATKDKVFHSADEFMKAYFPDYYEEKTRREHAEDLDKFVKSVSAEISEIIKEGFAE